MNTHNKNDVGRLLLRWLTTIDLVLLVSLFILIALGTATLFSATSENTRMMNMHTVHLILATVVMLIATQLSSEMLNRWSVWIYAFGIEYV